MLDNKTILITGAAGGLGSALARASLAAGANVILLDINQSVLEHIHDEAQAQHRDAVSLLPLDLSKAGPEDYQEIVMQIRRQHDVLDALVHCAVSFDALRLLEQIEPLEWQQQMQINLTAPWLLSNACMPLLRAAEAGMLIFMLEDMEKSAAAFRGAYGIAKHATRAMVSMYKQVNTDLTILGVNPGPMRSELRQKFYYAENPADQPEPQTKARQLIKILAGKSKAKGPFISL